MTKKVIPKKYFSGGVLIGNIHEEFHDLAQLSIDHPKVIEGSANDLQITVDLVQSSPAMATGVIMHKDLVNLHIMYFNFLLLNKFLNKTNFKKFNYFPDFQDPAHKSLVEIFAKMRVDKLFEKIRAMRNDPQGREKIAEHLKRMLIKKGANYDDDIDGIYFNPILETPETIRAFAVSLNEEWQKTGMEDQYGSIFQLVALNIINILTDDLKVFKRIYAWYYTFLSVADIKEQALGLWVILVGNIFHLRRLGMHIETFSGEIDPILVDHETIYGKEYAQGAVYKYLLVVEELAQANRLKERVAINNGNSVLLEDLLLWGLAMASDSTIFNPKYIINDPLIADSQKDLVKKLIGDLTPEQFIEQRMRQSFRFLDQFFQARGWVGKAVGRTNEEWMRARMLPPLSLFSIGEEFGSPKATIPGGSLFDFYLLKPANIRLQKNAHLLHSLTQLYPNVSNTGNSNQSLIDLGGDLGPVNRNFWKNSGLLGLSTNENSALGGIDFKSDRMNVETKVDASLKDGASKGIQFHIDPAMLKQLQNAGGFTPVIINIQPMTDIKSFLQI